MAARRQRDSSSARESHGGGQDPAVHRAGGAPGSLVWQDRIKHRQDRGIGAQEGGHPMASWPGGSNAASPASSHKTSPAGVSVRR